MPEQEFEKWLERIKGFEIIPDSGFKDPHFSMWEKFFRKWMSVITK